MPPFPLESGIGAARPCRLRARRTIRHDHERLGAGPALPPPRPEERPCRPRHAGRRPARPGTARPGAWGGPCGTGAAWTRRTRSLLDGLVRRHLVRHGGDPGRSVADLDPAGSVRRMLSLIAETRASDGNHPDSTRDCADGSDSPRGDVGPGDGPGGPSRPRFRIVRPHARGGLGEVYLAVDDELNRIVALKRLQERHADDPRSQMRFLVEGEITGGLEHPGIVPVYGLGFDDRDGRPYYAMRFIRRREPQGGHPAVPRGRRPRPGATRRARSLALRQLLGRFVDVCDAIEYAHSRGVLHRDLKPANIMLGPVRRDARRRLGPGQGLGAGRGADPLAGPRRRPRATPRRYCGRGRGASRSRRWPGRSAAPRNS